MKYLIGFLICVAIASCEPYASEIELPDESQKIVINSFFPADSTWKVGITRAKHLSASLDNTNGEIFFDIKNASVTIKEDGIVISTLSYKEPNLQWGWSNGFYSSSETVVPGSNYRIEVSAPGFPMAVATCSIPTAVPLTRTSILSEELDDNSRIPVTIEFQDEPGVENYYEVLILHRFTPVDPMTGEPRPMYSSTSTSLALTQDQLFNQRIEPFDFASPVPAEEPILFSDKGMDGEKLSISAKVSTYPPADDPNLKTERWIILRTLSREYFENIYTKALAGRADGDPFSQPVLVFSNVQGGHGIFAGYSESMIELR